MTLKLGKSGGEKIIKKQRWSGISRKKKEKGKADPPPRLPTAFRKTKIKKFYRKLEQQADDAAHDTLVENQLDPSQVNHLWQRLAQTTSERSHTHTRLIQRQQSGELHPEMIDPWWQQPQGQPASKPAEKQLKQHN
mgnify:CR=1 FL=1